MSSVAEGIANVLRTREPLDYDGDFITAQQDVANLRYSLLDELDRLPKLTEILPEKKPDPIQKRSPSAKSAPPKYRSQPTFYDGSKFYPTEQRFTVHSESDDDSPQ